MAKEIDWKKVPELSEAVKTRWMAGKSAAIIAYDLSKEFGVSLTKNQIIGVVHRMDLNRGEPSSPKKIVKTKVVQEAKPEPVVAPKKNSLPPETWSGKGECRHITGDPAKPGWVMCNNPAQPSKDYCDEHVAKMFVKPAK